MKKGILLFSVVALLMLGCKKDKMDLLAGVWDLSLLQIDGNDSTSAVKSQSCYKKLNFLTAEETHKRIAYNDNIIEEPWEGIAPCTISGFYELTNNETDLRILLKNCGIRAVGAYLSLQPPLGIYWSIKKLTSKELWIEVTFDNHLSVAHLKKQ